MSFRLWARALALAVATLAVVASSAAASFPGYNGKIAYTAFNVHGYGVFTVAPNGSGARALTDPDYSNSDSAPAWSADGRHIAFARGGQIWVMDQDGSSAHPVTSGWGATDPTWSPDGTRLAFSRFDIVVVDLATGVETNITPGSPGEDVAPDWSPDGTKIAFQSARDGHAQIYTVDPAGGSLTNVSHSDSVDVQPSWSPDGTKIAFTDN